LQDINEITGGKTLRVAEQVFFTATVSVIIEELSMTYSIKNWLIEYYCLVDLSSAYNLNLIYYMLQDKAMIIFPEKFLSVIQPFYRFIFYLDRYAGFL